MLKWKKPAKLIQFRHLDRFTLRTADATPDRIGNHYGLRYLFRADVYGQQKWHFGSMILADQTPAKTAGSVYITVAYPAFGSHEPNPLNVINPTITAKCPQHGYRCQGGDEPPRNHTCITFFQILQMR